MSQFAHSTADNVAIPRGQLYFAQFADGTTTPAKYETYFGSTPGATLNGSATKLDRFSSDGPVRIKTHSVVTQTDYKGSITTDNISFDNLAKFFLGTTATIADAGATITDETIGAVPVDAVVQLGISSTRPSGAKLVSSVAVSDGATLKTLGTHYELEATTGRVHALVAFANMVVDYVISASNRPRTISAGTQVKGALHLISENAQGDRIDYYMPSVTISPNGDLVLKGDGTAFAEIKMDLEVLAKDSSTAAVYVDGLAVAA